MVSDTESVTKAFSEIGEKLGAAPNVVILNGSSTRLRAIHFRPTSNSLVQISASRQFVFQNFHFCRNGVFFLLHDAPWPNLLNFMVARFGWSVPCRGFQYRL